MHTFIQLLSCAALRKEGGIKPGLRHASKWNSTPTTAESEVQSTLDTIETLAQPSVWARYTQT